MSSKEAPDVEFDAFMAHRWPRYAPDAVSGEKDEVYPEPTDPDDPPAGTVKPQQLDQTKLIPLLTAALQEALREIGELTKRVATLEAR